MLNIDVVMVGDVADEMPDGDSINLDFGGHVVTVTVKRGYFESIQQSQYGLDFMVGDVWALRIHSTPSIADDEDTKEVAVIEDDTSPNVQIIEGDTIPEADEDIWECPVCTHLNDDELQSCEMCGFDFEGESVGDDDTEGDDVNLGMADLIDA